MKAFLILVVLLRAANAEIACLTIAWWSPIAGLICALSPAAHSAIDTAAEKVVEEVKTTISQAENAADFSLNYNPITLTYNFIDTASREGIAAANSQLGQEARNISQVSIGFTKETVSQVMTVVQLTKLQNIAYCVVSKGQEAGIRGAYEALNPSNSRQPVINNQTASNSATSKRAIQDIKSQAEAIGRKCISDHFAKPLILNPTNEKQQQGADISDIAGLLVPVVGEEALAADAAAEAVDLAVPGVEDATRVLKLEGSATEGTHFASVQEAEQVSGNLGKKGWSSANCKICSSGGLTRRMSQSRYAGTLIKPRGAAFSMCCPIGEGKGITKGGDAGSPVADEASNAAGDAAGAQDAEIPEPDSQEVSKQPANSGSSGLPNGVTAEPEGTNPFFPDLKVISSIPVRSYEGEIQTVINDLSTQNTAALGYSQRAQAISDSKSIMTEIGDIVNSEDPALRDVLGFESDRATNRWQTDSTKGWLQSSEPRLEKLRQWCNQVTEDLTSASDQIMAKDPGMAGSINTERWFPSIHLYYTKAGTKLSPGTRGGILGFHTDVPYLSYSTSDVSGLTVALGPEETKLLTPVVDNGFYLLKGRQTGSATLHAVGSAEALEKGRAAIIVELRRAAR